MFYFIKNRLISFKSQVSLNEISGSFGDLGTLIPLLVAMSKENMIYLPGAFFWGGIFNIIAAFQWNIPMPVQPMKAIASVALTDGMTPNEIICAGLITSSVIFLLGITKTINIFNKIIPIDLISGMQLGLGLNMIKKGIDIISNINSWISLDSYTTSIIIGIFSLTLFRFKRLPVALILFSIGIIFAIINISRNTLTIVFIPIFPPIWIGNSLTLKDFLNGFIKGALPQLPLTTLNSVISVADLAKELFPNNYPSKISIATSIGIMNLVGCLFGGMPMCHGAGGLAGQYKFGARGGLSILILGIGKILLSIIFGLSLITILTVFPNNILGILIIFSGLQLAVNGINKCSSNITIISAGIILGTNTWIGFVSGYGIYIIENITYIECKKIIRQKKLYLQEKLHLQQTVV